MMKKALMGLGVCLLAATSLVAAPTATGNASTELAYGSSCNHSPSSSCGLCRSNDSCNHSSCTSCDWCDGDWSAHVDWLFWKVRRGGLDIGITDTGGVYDVFDGKCVGVDPDRDHGVRIGVGFGGCDCWDFAFEYTYMQADDHKTVVDADLGPTRVHTDADANATDDLAYARGHYELDYHVMDLTVGYVVHCDCDVTLRPFTGLRFVFVDQDMYTRYAEGNPPVLTNESVTDVWESINMDAYGFIGGLDVRWGFWDCFAMFGRMAGTVAYADFEISNIERNIDDDFGGGSDEYLVRLRCDEDRIIGIFEMQLGFEWMFWDSDCGKFSLALGWDFQTWVNMADWVNFTGNSDLDAKLSRNNQALGLEGLFVRVAGSF